MIGLTDPQLKIIMTMASGVPIERRGIFLERCGAMLRKLRVSSSPAIASTSSFLKKVRRRSTQSSQ